MKSYPSVATSTRQKPVLPRLQMRANRAFHLVGKATGVALALLLSGTTFAQAQTSRVILVGDSTMAPNNGYGEVLCQSILNQAECWNLAKNGRSSKSFRDERLWQEALDKSRTARPVPAQWLLIQFGHNDQPGKPGRSTDLASEYPENLARYIEEARTAGLKPVLVTPLIRRSFKDGHHIDDLQPWAQAMKTVASRLNVPLIDLHASSRDKVRSVGEAEADRYAVAPPGAKGFDRTHLGPLGACVFAAQVLAELPRVTEGQISPTASLDCDHTSNNSSMSVKN